MKKLRIVRKTKIPKGQYRSLHAPVEKDGFFLLEKGALIEVSESEAKELIRRGLAVPGQIMHSGPVNARGQK